MNERVNVHHDKPLLTLREAASYTGIGINKLRQMSNEPNCNFVLFIGRKRMFKRELLMKFLDQAYSINAELRGSDVLSYTQHVRALPKKKGEYLCLIKDGTTRAAS